MKEDLLITLVIYRYEYRAQILKDKLMEAGVQSEISSQSVFGQIDGVKVMVMQKDFERAYEVYKKIRSLYDNHADDVIEEANNQ